MITQHHHVVIVGGGFGGLYAARALADKPGIRVTLIDKRNFHLFQPLLYQVATGGLSPDDIAYPLRAVMRHYRNANVLNAEVTDILPETQEIVTSSGSLSFDTLIVATGVSHFYFGHDEWEQYAPGLKTLEDALEMRRRIFQAFEEAEKATSQDERKAWTTFVVVGGGPTGVELAGAIGELTQNTLKGEFRRVDPSMTQILLVEGADRVLPPYPADLSAAAAADLYRLGVTVRTGTLVSNIDADLVTLKSGEDTEQIRARTVLWAAGMRASSLGRIIHERTGAPLDRAGRVIVESDLSVAGHSNIFVIGDLANYQHQNGKPLPGVAQVAMQQGEYLGELISLRIHGGNKSSFYYNDKGNLAVIGRNAAVADIGRLHINGYIAWVIWLFVHIAYLIGFERKLQVMIQWSWSYLTRRHNSRLIVGGLQAASNPTLNGRTDERLMIEPTLRER
ncbi:MAG: NAD(P)/FAD-dependent oxidoreductase [Chloroflexaceae bacterium]|nr:NAD(P)/FAD-dependent oxidoreductase [Chloroflexaceae bacterium]NJO04692.1 NAD(P)/FAD-dependent oxidoreductase [Chloroflexaceae bacterium]